MLKHIVNNCIQEKTSLVGKTCVYLLYLANKNMLKLTFRKFNGPKYR